MDESRVKLVSFIVYFAALLLGRTIIAALNHHPEGLTMATFFPRQAFTHITCRDAWHPHYASASQYFNFLQAAQRPDLGGRALDGLYERTVDSARDFDHPHAPHRPVRLHVYAAPLHAGEAPS